MAFIYLVRHAKAGERRTWVGADIDRPLSKKGWKQAERISKKFVGLPVAGLFSSPYVRCVQTLEPLAARLGSTVEVAPQLTEYEPVEPVIELLTNVPNGSVMCSHGDIIPATIKVLKKSGTELRGQPDWRKAATWVLKRNKHGRIVHATAWPPPQLSTKSSSKK